MREARSDVVLVGHSLGSLTIPVVATMRPVRHLIFLCSVPTGPGPAIDAELASMVTPEFAAAGRVVDAAGRESLADADAIAVWYADCSDEDAAWAVARLRPQSRRPLEEPSPLVEWPDVPATVVLGRDDRCVNLGWAVPAATRAPRSTTGADARRPLAVPEPARRARGPARRGRDRLTADQHAQIGRRYQDGQRGFSISKPTGVPQWLRYETSCTGRRAATPHFPVG